MLLSERNEQAWQDMLKDNPRILTGMNPKLVRTIFDYGFYMALQKPKKEKN